MLLVTGPEYRRSIHVHQIGKSHLKSLADLVKGPDGAVGPSRFYAGHVGFFEVTGSSEILLGNAFAFPNGPDIIANFLLDL